MIANLTNCQIKVGQNGMIVVDGTPEGTVKAVEAIQLVDREAHMADLTTKVQQLLGGQAAAPRRRPLQWRLPARAIAVKR